VSDVPYIFIFLPIRNS